MAFKMHFSGATRIRIFIIIVLIVILWQIMKKWPEITGQNEEIIIRPSGAPVLVTVYYEALCPDSKNFILKQLQTTFVRAPNLIEIQLIPYGKARTGTNSDGSLSFECQHGPVECQANTIHACVIETIKEADVRLNLISCMIRDNTMPRDALHRCAKELYVEPDQILKCFDSPHGSELLKLYGDATNALRPRVTFIPTVTLDGAQGRQPSILKDLFTEVCKVAGDRGPLPASCEN